VTISRQSHTAAVWAAQEREQLNWERMLYLLLALHLIMSLFFSPTRVGANGHRGWLISLIATVIVAIATATLGRSAARDRDLIGRATGSVFLAIVLGAVTTISATGYLPTFLWLFSYIQIWMLVYEPLWKPLIISFLFVVIPFIAYWFGQSNELGSFAALVPSIVWNFVISAGFGWFIIRQHQQTLKHALLFDELQATQAKLAESQHAAGVAAERQRIGAEIHDTLAQGFTSIVMQAQVAKAAIGRDDEAVRERIDLIEQVARENLVEARSLVVAMAQTPARPGGLAEAVRETAARFANEAAIPVTVTIPDDGIPGLSSSNEVVLIRALQEALNNIRRHANARAVTVNVSGSDAQEVVLEIGDDGIGIRPGITEGYGLSGMRNRVSAAAGTMVVTSNSSGTSIRITLPIDNELESVLGDDQ